MAWMDLFDGKSRRRRQALERLRERLATKETELRRIIAQASTEETPSLDVRLKVCATQRRKAERALHRV